VALDLAACINRHSCGVIGAPILRSVENGTVDLQWDVPAMLINIKRKDLVELFLVEGKHRIVSELRLPEGSGTIIRLALDALSEEGT
jgi:hypothetical protein